MGEDEKNWPDWSEIMLVLHPFTPPLLLVCVVKRTFKRADTSAPQSSSRASPKIIQLSPNAIHLAGHIMKHSNPEKQVMGVLIQPPLIVASRGRQLHGPERAPAEAETQWGKFAFP